MTDIAGYIHELLQQFQLKILYTWIPFSHILVPKFFPGLAWALYHWNSWPHRRKAKSFTSLLDHGTGAYLPFCSVAYHFKLISL